MTSVGSRRVRDQVTVTPQGRTGRQWIRCKILVKTCSGEVSFYQVVTDPRSVDTPADPCIYECHKSDKENKMVAGLYTTLQCSFELRENKVDPRISLI
ncbi:hypothetical protein BgiMline_012345 [Biomphalaria glabrata]